MKDTLDTATVDMFGQEEKMTSKLSGRPRVYLSNAEKQKAYRARLAAKGITVVTRQILDVSDHEKPLVSDIIDLSEVRQKT